MKKVICAAAAVLMVASLTACSGQSGESAAAGEGNTQQADGYPNKTIQVIVPFNAGSTTDTQCRFILPYLEKELGVSMAVVNNGGASGVIGTTDFLSLGGRWIQCSVFTADTYSLQTSSGRD